MSDGSGAILIDLSTPPVPVQGAWVPDGRSQSDTELARLIAQHSEWKFTVNGELLDADDLLIAETITVAAAAMRRLGWFTSVDDAEHAHHAAIVWDQVPQTSSERAAALQHHFEVLYAGARRVRYQHVPPDCQHEELAVADGPRWGLVSTASLVTLTLAAVVFFISINLSFWISLWTTGSLEAYNPCVGCPDFQSATPSPGGWMIWGLAVIAGVYGAALAWFLMRRGRR